VPVSAIGFNDLNQGSKGFPSSVAEPPGRFSIGWFLLNTAKASFLFSNRRDWQRIIGREREGGKGMSVFLKKCGRKRLRT
jgi:hypothetical protein